MRIPLKAWYFDSTIDLKQALTRFPGSQILDDTLLIPIDSDRQVCLTSFGGLVFWHFDQQIARKVVNQIKQIVPDAYLIEKVEDRLVVETHSETSKVLFDQIMLEGPADPEVVCVISHLLAQSVALEHLELEVDRTLDEFGIYLNEIRKRGRVRLPTRRILKSTGFAMSTRYAVLNKLALFDRPDAIWESEKLEKIYNALYDFLELDDRQETISVKLDFLADNTTFLFNFLSTRKSLLLEWTIVILIALEIAFFVIYEILR